MARVKRLKSVAYGVCDHFLSLYNRIDGYWALGVLYKQALNANSKTISINLTDKSIVPSTIEANELLEYFNGFLYKLIDNHNIKRDIIKQAFINIKFDVEESKFDIGSTQLHGKPLICEVVIIDTNKNRYTMNKRDRCKEFDKGFWVQNRYNMKI